jgi:hypothetical protein
MGLFKDFFENVSYFFESEVKDGDLFFIIFFFAGSWAKSWLIIPLKFSGALLTVAVKRLLSDSWVILF